MAELSISMVGNVHDLQQNPERIAALEDLGVKEILLFMMGPTVDDTFKEIEEGARTFMN